MDTGLVRPHEANGFSGDVRLLPAAGVGAAGAVALGPIIAVMAITVGSEALSRHQLPLPSGATSAGAASYRCQREPSRMGSKGGA